MAKLGWIFGPGTCANVDSRAALFKGTGSEVRRVACGPRTSICRVCPVDRVVWRYDATPVLQQFAREAALDVVHLWDPPPVVLRWLKTGDESIREEARLEAESAAYLTAYSAAWVVARSAAGSAAKSAAWSVARSAAWSAAHSAARSVTASAARSAAHSAAQSVTASAAGPAGEREQSRYLGRLLIAGRKLYS